MKPPSRPTALIEALIVVLIWASSFILVKIALADLGPLTIGGLRYFLAFILLLPFLPRSKKKIPSTGWMQLLLLGLSSYTIGNGLTFIALQFLPATTTAFMMSNITILVVLGGIIWLREIPDRRQSTGIILAIIGVGLFFSHGFETGQRIGIVVMGLAVVSFAAFALLGRKIARNNHVDTMTLTAVPLGLGGASLLMIAIAIEGIPSASLSNWLIVLWLAAVNTALGYVLYNHALQSLTAFEMNVILTLTPLVTAIMGYFFLHEKLSIFQMTGMVIVLTGILLVQQRKTPK